MGGGVFALLFPEKSNNVSRLKGNSPLRCFLPHLPLSSRTFTCSAFFTLENSGRGRDQGAGGLSGSYLSTRA